MCLVRRDQRLPCDRGSRLAGIRLQVKNGAKNAVKRMTTCHTPETVLKFEHGIDQIRDHGKHRTETMGETEGTGASATVHGFVGEGSLAQDFRYRS